MKQLLNELVAYLKLKTSLDLILSCRYWNSIDNQQLKDFAGTKKVIHFSISSKVKLKKEHRPNPEYQVQKEEITSNYDLLVFGQAEQDRARL